MASNNSFRLCRACQRSSDAFELLDLFEGSGEAVEQVKIISGIDVSEFEGCLLFTVMIFFRFQETKVKMRR
jgi:hypothetical protein